MSEAALPLASVSVAEFLATDYGQRAELVNGVVYAMGGAAARHNKVEVNAVAALIGPARALGCELFAADQAVKISETTVYLPDVVVVCDPTDNDWQVRERPCLIIEVLSPSTASIDQREKRIAYEQIPSMRDYLIVDADNYTVDHHCRVPSEHPESPSNTDVWSMTRRHRGDAVPNTCLGSIAIDDLFIGI
jgi:Uma2 family endonuclease